MKVEIKNFRSIKNQMIEIAPLTVIYGPNASGKSSLLYALLTLKNIILNPNQNPSGFFNYAFTSLGSFDAVIFDHQTDNDIALGFNTEKDDLQLIYRVSLGEQKGNFNVTIEKKGQFNATLQLPVSFPYSLNQQTEQSITIEQKAFVVTWNGITVQVQSTLPDLETQDEANSLATSINTPIELLRKVSIIPLKRGFSKPIYSSVSVSPLLITEDEVATLLSNDKYLVSKVSFYLEQILGRDFRVNFKPGTAIFSLDATDKKTGVASELVNDGFGVNQIVYFIAKCLYRDIELVCVEEPEIHLHPSAVRQLARTIVQIIRDEEKHFIITTHSEAFISALLALVAKGELNTSALTCYLARKDKKITQFEHQAVNEKGQIEGGLTSFIEGELEDIKTFLKLAK